MKIIKYEDEEFPESLRDIKTPPKKIYVLGNEKLLHEKAIAVIGSRDCTENGKMQAAYFAKEISMQNLVVISGMAKGIDAAAHYGCLENNGRTIAVLGCGFNNIYPKQNENLFYEILENGGTIVSEYAPNVEAQSEYFRQRNRIVSGLSMGVLVIEAEHRSGTTITANYAREEGKPIFCIPNSIDNSKGIGTNEMLKKDAILVTNIEDILNKLEIKKLRQIRIEELEKNCKNIIKDKKEVKEEYKKIYEILSDTPIHINEICKKANITIQEASSTLLLMEIEGLVINVTGNQYKKQLEK